MKKGFDHYERAPGKAVLVGLGAAALLATGTAVASFAVLPPDMLPLDSTMQIIMGKIAGTTDLQKVVADIKRMGFWPDITLRGKLLAGAGGLGFIIGFLYTHDLCGWQLKGRWRQMTGVRLRPPPEGWQVAKRVFRQQMDSFGSRFLLAPSVDLPFEHEVLGTLITGAPGTGKTQIIKYWLSQWLRRRDTRLVVLDAGKGDMISGWPDEDFCLLAPADDRVQPGPNSLPQAMAWDIASDLIDIQDAREFAARVIPESGNDPQWAKGARMIVVAILSGLMREYGQSWGWRDFYDALAMPDVDLHAWVEKHCPEALSYVAIDDKGNATRNAMSFINNFKAALIEIAEPLAHAWGDVPHHRRLSLRQWLIKGTMPDGRPAPRTIILGRSGRMSGMSAGWIGSVFRLFSSIVKDAELSEDLHRRVLFVLDEFATIAAKGDGIEEFKAFGRSKGIGVVLGVQSMQQLIRAWGEEEFATFDETVELKVIGKTQKTVSQGTGAKAIAEMVGYGHFTRKKPKKKGDIGPAEDQEVDRLIVTPEFFVSNLGKHRKGLRAAVMLPDDLCVLDWPYTTWPEVRPAIVAPRWVKSLSDIAKKGVTAKDPLGVADGPDDGRSTFWGRIAAGWRSGAGYGFTGRLGGLGEALWG